MRYAALLYFDRETERVARDIMQSAVRAGINDYMLRHAIPPHLTLAMGGAANEDSLMRAIGGAAASMARGGVRFASLGAFVPRVCFLAPVMNRYLHEGNIRMNEAFAKAGAPEEGYQYGQWVPHMTIAVQMTPTELCLAFSAAQEEFSAFAATAEELALVRCDPYVEIGRWKLRWE